MEAFILDNLQYAPYLFFFLLMLAGLNIPLSEDLLLISGGALATTLPFSQGSYLFTWILAGCVLSAWEAYWLGRLLGKHLKKYQWFRSILSTKRQRKLKRHYMKHGLLTFMIIRWIPGGLRNALFMSAGMGKMRFIHFILIDFIACIPQVLGLFSLGYFFATHQQELTSKFHHFQTAFILFSISFLVLLYLIKRRKMTTEKHPPLEDALKQKAQ